MIHKMSRSNDTDPPEVMTGSSQSRRPMFIPEISSKRASSPSNRPKLPGLSIPAAISSSTSTSITSNAGLRTNQKPAVLGIPSTRMRGKSPVALNALNTEVTESPVLLEELQSLSLAETKPGNSKVDVYDKEIEDLEEDDWKYLFNNDDIAELDVLGEGIGGSVRKCKLKHNSRLFALKIITTDPNPDFQRQMIRELKFNRSFNSPNIVQYYGTFINEKSASIYICMEYMGGKSLDAIYKNIKTRGGRIGEKVLGKIAESVLKGLSYLHERKIIHRDIKPQNILLNFNGEVKLCDFGVSGEVINSLATTFTGTSYYMAPERIKNEPYTVTSDVWSLGLTLLEVAQGRFPYYSERDHIPLTPIELLSMILNFTPTLEDEPAENIYWSPAFKSFLHYCLVKDRKKRHSPHQMLKHPWMISQSKKSVKMDRFVRQCWEE
ncbi:BA75_00794T0 [Komagataella pastoris]|uniref:mitogen-activated protein kinase kinase n=1 Tax=Komagataella pastoris TaxID=4922 RepID=A0A1B2J6R5_PICPA|nr:BA75_00794T0 [Komagataella pastoris]